MGWLRKKKVPLGEVAALLAQIICPSEFSQEDVSLNELALSVGAHMELFRFEMLAFQAFVANQIINQESFEGRLQSDTATQLVSHFFLAIAWRLQNVEHLPSLPSGLPPQARTKMASILMDRTEDYRSLVLAESALTNVPRLFAQHCDQPNSDAIAKIATSLLTLRGKVHGDLLRRIKIV
jgi:hypothetical protein